MGKYDSKYGIVCNEEIREFHKRRRMFCVKDVELLIAKPGLDYSHAEWFEEEGWMTINNDEFMYHTMRGIVDQYGDIYFYVGYDFEVNSQIERTFFQHLDLLAMLLNLKPDSNIYGGCIIDHKETVPRTKYKTLQYYLDDSHAKIDI